MIQQDTMEQIIRSQQEQIAGLLETNRSLVESNGKLLEQTDALQRKIQERGGSFENKARWKEEGIPA